MGSDILFQGVSDVLHTKLEVTKALARLGIITIRDLLFYRPNSYQIRDLAPNLSQLQEGQLIQTQVIIEKIVFPSTSRGPIKILVTNETGSAILVFFNKIPPFIFNKLAIGSKHIISGKAQYFDNYLQIAHPEFCFNKPQESGLEPIYSLTYSLVNRQLYSYIIQGLDILEKIIEQGNKELGFLYENLRIIHLYKVNLLPNEISQFWQTSIRNLAENELFANQVLLSKVRKQKHIKNGRSFLQASEIHHLILKNLSFTLTTAQVEVLSEITLDQKQDIQMMRLLQGDVGSGKTLVALLAQVNVANAKSQSVLMAPTDLLANQHYEFFKRALDGIDIKIGLLTGKTLQKHRKEIMRDLEDGEIDILIGTHALFQDKVNFNDLGFIVIDEQHKFGVEQRLSLINKASHPDVLIMTATPIPRSLTLTMFGDMSVSKLKSKPLNRLPITTTIVSSNKTEDVIASLSKKLDKGEKIYWVCPLIDQKDKSLGETDRNIFTDVHSRFDTINQLYPNMVGIIHGKMSGEQKDTIMQKYKTGEIYILVATTVIEVGIDVPDATLIIIENAEQFGLAQMHQLRGRVGRGNLQSHCILMYNPRRLSNSAKIRLDVMRKSNDGFYIAEQDMLLRGSGEILGTRQSGEPVFFFADLTRDLDLLVEASKLAEHAIQSKFIDFQIRLFSKNLTDNSVITS